MGFFSSLYKSLYNVQWLKTNKTNRRGGWKYFFGFVALITLAMVVVMGVSLFTGVKEVKEKVLTAVPEFEATFKGGELSITGLRQPFIYRSEDANKPSVVVVVDTTSTSSPKLDAVLKEGESGLLITKEQVEFFDANQGQGRTQAWKNMPDTTFNRARAVSLINKFLSPPFLALLLVIIGIFLFIGLVIGKLISILIVTLLSLIVAKLFKRAWRWGELFTVALFAITLPSILSFVLPYLHMRAGYIPFLVLLAFMLALVLTRDETTAPATSQNSTPPQA